MSAKIEAMARAGYEAMRERRLATSISPTVPWLPWEVLCDDYRHIAWAMYHALAEPTEAMRAAGYRALDWGPYSEPDNPVKCWTAMHKAAGET